MRDIEMIRAVFNAHGGMMRTGELNREKIYYADIQYGLHLRSTQMLKPYLRS